MRGSLLSPDMKSALALDMAIVVSLVIGSVSYLLSGDIYAVTYLSFSLPYLAFFYFGLKVRSWSYLGSSILSAFLLVFIAVTAVTLIDLSATAIVTWEIAFAIILFSLNFLEGVRAYFQTKGSTNLLQTQATVPGFRTDFAH
jgi:hypothetical protein